MSKKLQTAKSESQHDKFIKTARAIDCDESEEAFAEKLKGIASVKPVKNEGVKEKANKK